MKKIVITLMVSLGIVHSLIGSSLGGFDLQQEQAHEHIQENLIDGKFYVKPGSVYVAPDGVFVNVEGVLMEVYNLSKDEHGVYFPYDQVVREVFCPSCGKFYNPMRTHRCSAEKLC